MSDTNNANATPGDITEEVTLQLAPPAQIHPFTIESPSCSITFHPRSRFIARFLQALVGIEWRVKQ